MVISDRLRTLREEKKLSQGDIENSTGLFRSYISRVENGHTVSAAVTLEKLARLRTNSSTTARNSANRPKHFRASGRAM